MKRELLKIAKDLDHEKIDKDKARTLLLSLLGVVGSDPKETIYVSHGNDGDDDVYCAFTNRNRGQKDCDESGTILTKITLYRGNG